MGGGRDPSGSAPEPIADRRNAVPRAPSETDVAITGAGQAVSAVAADGDGVRASTVSRAAPRRAVMPPGRERMRHARPCVRRTAGGNARHLPGVSQYFR
ncbi:hypothetical protein GCM10009544_46820 [Streptomyces stramineus]|uniref:Uncharacterized protein n=1 Tax=Streptomyces stramineus TaxID=173861 RepID=A0ABN1ALJ2_9ACTN